MASDDQGSRCGTEGSENFRQRFEGALKLLGAESEYCDVINIEAGIAVVGVTISDDDWPGALSVSASVAVPVDMDPERMATIIRQKMNEGTIAFLHHLVVEVHS